MKTYNFDEIIPRKGTNCVKYDALQQFFGAEDLLPMWVADMDFRSPDFVIDALRRRLDHEVLGYATAPDSYWQTVAQWLNAHYGINASREQLHFIPGIVAGIAMQWLQLFYVHSQLWVTGYNAIYGSFAALPLFMLWVQISWTICLFGAELTFTNQHMKRMGFNLEQHDFHPYVEMSDDERSDAAINHYADGIDSL